MIAIKRIRLRKGITQQAMADALQISPATISHWETGRRKPNVDDMIAIAQYFGCSIDDLIDKENT